MNVVTYRFTFRGSIEDLTDVMQRIMVKRHAEGLPWKVTDDMGEFSFDPEIFGDSARPTQFAFRQFFLVSGRWLSAFITLTPFPIGRDRTEVQVSFPPHLATHERYIAGCLAPWIDATKDTAPALPSGDQAGEMQSSSLDLPAEPPRPGESGATWDDVFDWYYSVPRAVCENLEDLARLICLAPGTVRNRHGEYKAQHSDKMSSRE